MLTLAIAALAAALSPADSSVRFDRAIVRPPVHVPMYASASRADTTSSLLQRGDDLLLHQHYQLARDAYRAAARLSVATGGSPVAALRHAAESYFFAGDVRRAAESLDEVIDQATAYGDLMAEAEALVDAATLYGQLGDAPAFADRRERAERLLGSAYLPPAGRAQLRARLDAGHAR